jgi:hypothetical protein
MMLLSLAGAVSALALASPAAAQWAPQPWPYGAPGYGYGQRAPLQARIAHIRDQIARLDQERRLNPWQARRLFNEARQLDQRVREERFEGDRPELRQLEERVEGLERRVREAANHNRYGGDRDDHRWGDDDGN